MPTVVRGRLVYIYFIMMKIRYTAHSILSFIIDFIWIGSDIAAIANNWSYFRWHIKNLIFVWFACFSSILWLIWFIIICYEIRANGWSINGMDKNMTSLIIVFSLDNIWSMNLDTCLDQVNIYLELNYESFTLLLLTNIIL